MKCLRRLIRVEPRKFTWTTSGSPRLARQRRNSSVCPIIAPWDGASCPPRGSRNNSGYLILSDFSRRPRLPQGGDVIYYEYADEHFYRTADVFRYAQKICARSLLFGIVFLDNSGPLRHFLDPRLRGSSGNPAAPEQAPKPEIIQRCQIMEGPLQQPVQPGPGLQRFLPSCFRLRLSRPRSRRHLSFGRGVHLPAFRWSYFVFFGP